MCGVTYFSTVSIFSDLNNLFEVSLVSDYADICGITEEELRRFLMPEVEALSRELGLEVDEGLSRLRERYDGSCFHARAPEANGTKRDLSPFSLMCALQSRDFGQYWFETGTPTH